MLEAVPFQNGFERHGALDFGFSQCRAGVPEILLVFERFDSSKVLHRQQGRHRLSMSMDDQTLAAVFGAAKQVGELIFGFGHSNVAHGQIMASLAIIGQRCSRQRVRTHNRAMRRFFKYVGIFVIVLVVIAAIVAAIGMALPAGHDATRSARINAPITVVYRLLITPEAYPEWRPDVERVERMDSDRFREFGKDGPIVFRIIQRDPPSRVVIAVDDPDQPFSGTWTFELQQEGEGDATRVRITERGTVPNPLIRAIARVMMSPTEGLEAYLRNLGRRFGQDVTIEP